MLKLIHRTVALLFLLSLPLAPSPVAASDDDKNQVVVFGGIAILEASGEDTRTFPIPFPTGPGATPFPFRPGRNLDLEIRTRTELGNSPVFGVRYSRYLKGRLAVEADLEVAPTHTLDTGGELCLQGRCFGPGDRPGFPGGAPQRFDIARDVGRQVTAWHYGGGLAYDITGGDVRPVLVFGAGGVTWSGASRSETSFELRFGVGLKVLFGSLGLRVDVIDHLILDHFVSGKSEHDLQATVGFLVGF